MWQSRKIKAFTLMELVVTLVVSTVIFGACYLLLQMVQKSHASFSKKGKAMLEVNGLRHALTHDFEKSRYVLLSNDGVTCFGDSGAAAYLFEGNQVTRLLNVSDRVDTFHVYTGEVAPRFGQQEIFILGRLVESLSVDVHTAQDTFRLHVQRPYSAEERINLAQAIQK